MPRGGVGVSSTEEDLSAAEAGVEVFSAEEDLSAAEAGVSSTDTLAFLFLGGGSLSPGRRGVFAATEQAID